MNLKGFKKWFQRLRQPEAPETPPSIPAPGREGRRPAAPEAAKTPPAQATPQDTAPRGRSPGKPPRPRRPLSRKPAAQRPVSRQGIPILRPDEDLAGYFMAGEEDPARQEQAGTKTGDGPPSIEGARDRSRRRAAPGRNRAGMRQLEGEHDLWRHFLSTPSAAAEPGPSAAGSDRRKANGGVPDTAPGTDRHGIPRLDNHAALERYFETTVDDPSQAEALGEVFRQSLDHDAGSLLKKKTGGVFAPRRLTLKERLRRYPAPQAQLDLHGATALEARQRTEVFLRSARADGLFTLRVIVGKGLHSEGGAVLPDVIEELLLALKRTGTVLTYRWEKDIKRKSGAVIVYLSPP